MQVTYIVCKTFTNENILFVDDIKNSDESLKNLLK